MTLKEYREILARVPQEYDDSEVCMRFAEGSPYDRHYTEASMMEFNLAVLKSGSTPFVAVGCTCDQYGELHQGEKEETLWKP